MPLDHYVPQVHLKNFYSPELGELMYAIRKNDQMMFTPNSQSVCRIEDGSTNSYLREDRIIEEFPRGVEPKYNSAVNKVLESNFDIESIYVVSGFVSYIISCSPAGMRIHSELFRGTVEESARYLDKLDVLPSPPPQLGGDNLTELLENEKIKIEIDEKYPQAVGISSILSHVAIFGNSDWEVLINPLEDSPFFTSDYPVAIEKTRDPRILNRVIPLTPYLAIRIKPDISLDMENPDYEFTSFQYKHKRLSRTEVSQLNKLFVRCAETTVFFSRLGNWTKHFVSRNSGFRIEPKTNRFPHGNGTLLWFTQEVSKIQS